MTIEQRDKYAYELMVKNNPEEVVKQLLLKDKTINAVNKLNQQNLEKKYLLQQRIDKAIEYIENAYEEEYHKPKEEIKTFNFKNCTYEPSLVVLGILKGE